MPRGDGTGPIRDGRMTGWGLGFCGGHATPGHGRYGWRRGMGRIGGGRGWGRRHQFRHAGMLGWNRGVWHPSDRLEEKPPTEMAIETERVRLERLTAQLEGELDLVRRRMKELGITGKTSE